MAAWPRAAQWRVKAHLKADLAGKKGVAEAGG